MTFGKFFGFAFLLWAIQAVVKVLFINGYGLDTQAMEYLYWLLIAIVTIALVRRLGYINYLEAMLVAGFWFFIGLIMDFILTSPILGEIIASRWEVWVGYAVMLLVTFFFHKKRHIQVRKEQAAHHGHH
jgi:hypothetical protein